MEKKGLKWRLAAGGMLMAVILLCTTVLVYGVIRPRLLDYLNNRYMMDANGVVTAYDEDKKLASELACEGEESEESWDGTSIETGTPAAYWALTELALSYDQKIPYAEGGRYGREGYPVIAAGIDNRFMEKDDKMGLDSLGYLLWLFKNTTGEDQTELEQPYELIRDCGVNAEQLQVGDIGMYSTEAGGNHYGVCVGFLDGRAVFSHCDSKPTKAYPGGINHLSFLAEQTSQCLDGFSPEPFTYFVRPQIDWEEEVE
mgnify:CR=1 FL=1